MTVAKTAMWISEAKMLRETAELLHRSLDFLPLRDYAGIVEGNALRMEWEGIFVNSDESEGSANASPHFDYIIGNPPFVGARSDGETVVKPDLPTVGVRSSVAATAQAILDARALYPDSSLADLYDPLTMPPELRKAHAANDAAVLKAYGWPTDLAEPEIVSRLFEMYGKLTAGEV